jgi:hypothetical protein
MELQHVAVQECLQRREMGDLIRDLIARMIRSKLPKGWADGTDFDRVQAVSVGALPEPYATLALAVGKLITAEGPPPQWLPESGEDERLRSGYQRALESLSAERRKGVELGEVEPRPGDLYRSKLEPIWKQVSIYEGETVFSLQFEKVGYPLGNLFAAHWCHSEIRNGGFHQFFYNPTGVLAPEAVRGFHAMEMSENAALLSEAMGLVGTPYPRQWAARQKALPATSHFRRLDDAFFARLRAAPGEFAAAADAYARTL